MADRVQVCSCVEGVIKGTVSPVGARAPDAFMAHETREGRVSVKSDGPDRVVRRSAKKVTNMFDLTLKEKIPD